MDSGGGELFAQDLRGERQARLGGAVVGAALEREAASQAADVDDRGLSAGGHAGREEVRQAERRQKVDRQQGLADRPGGVQERAHLHHPGAVDEEIDRRERERPLDQARERGPVREVAGEPARERSRGRGHPRQPSLVAVDQGQARARPAAEQRRRERGADPRGGAGHERVRRLGERRRGGPAQHAQTAREGLASANHSARVAPDAPFTMAGPSHSPGATSRTSSWIRRIQAGFSGRS